MEECRALSTGQSTGALPSPFALGSSSMGPEMLRHLHSCWRTVAENAIDSIEWLCLLFVLVVCDRHEHVVLRALAWSLRFLVPHDVA